MGISNINQAEHISAEQTKENNMKNLARHGDVSFHQITEIPKTSQKLFTGKQYVVQEGEVTGHKHVLRSKKDFDVYEDNGRLLYLLNAPAVITHEDHLTYIDPIKKGLFEQKQEIEEDPFTGMLRQVID